MKIGNAKYGSGSNNNFVQRKYFKLKDGECVFRILPPIGDLAEQGRWSVFWNVHYGYKNTEGKMRPFQSPLVKNRKTKMVEAPDAALERIESLKAELEKAKASGDKSKVEKLLTLAGGTKSLYNLDSHHYMNVVDLQGNIGILKIRHRCKVALDAEIKRLQSEGVDPLSANDGRFFVFRRTGMGLDTTFQVTVYQENQVIGGQKVKVEKTHVLDDALIARMEREAAFLDKIFKKPTSEEVALIVKHSDLLTGVSPACDEIFDKQQKTQAAAPQTEESEDEPNDEYEEPKPLAKAAAPAPKPVVTSKVEAPKAEVPKAAAPAEQSDAEFLASLGL